MCADNLDTHTGECQNLLVCVTESTTQSQRLKEVVSADHIIETSDTPETIERFVQGECNAIAAGFVETAPANIASLGYTGSYEIGPTAYSRESLALVTRQDDALFSTEIGKLARVFSFALKGSTNNAMTCTKILYLRNEYY